MVMTQPSRDMLADLERHAELLGANVAKMTRALDHWHLLEAEYEALADEVRQARADFAEDVQAQQADLVRIRRDFDGQLVDHRTVCELFGARLGQPITRSSEQIERAVDRRLDYVRQNAATLQKQAEAAANRLAAAEVVRNPGGAGNDNDDDDDDDGAFEPVTDIVEELDDDDNVVHVRLNTPSTVTPHVMTALQQAGIDELAEAGGEAKAEAKEEAKDEAVTDASEQQQTETEEPPKPTHKPSLRPNLKPRRTVAFAADTKGSHEDGGYRIKEVVDDDDDDDGNAAAEYSLGSDTPQPPSLMAQRLERVMRAAAEQEAAARTAAAGAGVAGPLDESSEDAALRREMLEYSKSEIGPIVAQLDLEEGSDPDGDDDDDDEEDGSDFYDYDEEEEEDDDDDDEHGRAKYSIIDEAYRERMKELEKKLGVARPLPPEEAAPAKAPSAVDDAAEKLGRIRIAGGESGTATTTATATTAPTSSSLKKAGAAANGQKKVAFAETLDVSTPDASSPIAPEAAPALAEAKPAVPRVEPMRDIVLERGASSSGNNNNTRAPVPPTPPGAAAAAPKRASRFRMARGGAPAALPKGPHEAPVRFLDQERAVAPSGPEGQTLADAVVERQTPAAGLSSLSSGRAPDELDAGILLQETAAAYHRTRNRLIQQQGGFMRASEAAVVPVAEAEGGVRVSKFKAARLGREFL